MINESDIKDVNGTTVKEGDKLNVYLQPTGIKKEGTVIYKNKLFGVMLLDNDPFSCSLSELKQKVKYFEVVTTTP